MPLPRTCHRALWVRARKNIFFSAASNDSSLLRVRLKAEKVVVACLDVHCIQLLFPKDARIRSNKNVRQFKFIAPFYLENAREMAKNEMSSARRIRREYEQIFLHGTTAKYGTKNKKKSSQYFPSEFFSAQRANIRAPTWEMARMHD